MVPGTLTLAYNIALTETATVAFAICKPLGYWITTTCYNATLFVHQVTPANRPPMPKQILQDSVAGKMARLAAEAAAPHNKNICPSAMV